MAAEKYSDEQIEEFLILDKIGREWDYVHDFRCHQVHYYLHYPRFGILDIGSLVEIKEDNGDWVKGVLEKILFAPEPRQTTFFVRVARGVYTSIPYRPSHELKIRGLKAPNGENTN